MQSGQPESSRKRPLLIDCKGIADEIGVKRATAERLMRLCPRKVPIGRRVFVYTDDVFRVVRQHEVHDA